MDEEGLTHREANRIDMLLRHRPPGIDSTSVQLRAGFEHLEANAVAVLRWLNANKIDYVVVGPVGHAIRGDLTAKGAVAMVPAPYARNYDRLAKALIAAHAGLRSERGIPGASVRAESVSVQLSGEKLARGRRWMLRFGDYDLDVERSGPRPGGDVAAGGTAPVDEPHTGEPAGARYQELLYEASRFDLCDEIGVQVASPEDLEHYSHVRRTGTSPEFRVRRNLPEESVDGAGPGAAEGRGRSSAPDAGSSGSGGPTPGGSGGPRPGGSGGPPPGGSGGSPPDPPGDPADLSSET